MSPRCSIDWLGVAVLVVGISVPLGVLLAWGSVERDAKGLTHLVEALVVQEIKKHPQTEAG